MVNVPLPAGAGSKDFHEAVEKHWLPALDAYRQGIAVAETKGDKQAAREMAVFARRIEKQLESGQSS